MAIDLPTEYLMATKITFTVLLVEDEPIIRMGTADHIRSQGYAVIEAGTCDRAMDMIRSGKAVDIVVTDVQMPGQHDGIALALWTRRNFPAIRLIIVSGATSGAVAPDLLGEEGWIMPKPYRYGEVVARIRALLDDTHPPLSAAMHLDIPVDTPGR
jgi:DNA-binding response OmpR family regulator